MSRVVHFAIHAADPVRAIHFYASLFGWQFKKSSAAEDQWLIKTGANGQPGIDGLLLPRRGTPPIDDQPMNGYLCTIDVPSVELVIEEAERRGGALVAPKSAVPGVGWIAYLKDPEGNLFGVMRRDLAAR